MITATEKRKMQRANSRPYRDICGLIKRAVGNSTIYCSEGRPMAKYLLKELENGDFTIKCRYNQKVYRKYKKSYITHNGNKAKRWKNKIVSERTIKTWNYTISW